MKEIALLRIALVGVGAPATCAVLIAHAAATAPVPAACATPEAMQFDFWLGTWDLRWKNADGTGGNGRNRIERALDGCVIVENFESFQPEAGAPALRGLSVSTWDPRAAQWKQTWVDNTGAYLDFVGGWRDGRMVLARNEEHNGKRSMQRMVFRDIGADTLVWDWQSSTDSGATFTTQWQIEYRRAK